MSAEMKRIQGLAMKSSAIIAINELTEMERIDPDFIKTKKAVYVQIFVSGYLAAKSGE